MPCESENALIYGIEKLAAKHVGEEEEEEKWWFCRKSGMGEVAPLEYQSVA